MDKASRSAAPYFVECPCRKGTEILFGRVASQGICVLARNGPRLVISNLRVTSPWGDIANRNGLMSDWVAADGYGCRSQMCVRNQPAGFENVQQRWLSAWPPHGFVCPNRLVPLDGPTCRRSLRPAWIPVPSRLCGWVPGKTAGANWLFGDNGQLGAGQGV